MSGITHLNALFNTKNFITYIFVTNRREIRSLCPVAHCTPFSTRREFLREILYINIAIIAIQHNKIYFVNTFGDFSPTIE